MNVTYTATYKYQHWRKLLFYHAEALSCRVNTISITRGVFEIVRLETVKPSPKGLLGWLKRGEAIGRVERHEHEQPGQDRVEVFVYGAESCPTMTKLAQRLRVDEIQVDWANTRSPTPRPL
jgi:hypothetical protein